MKIYCISDEIDITVGLKLTGIQSIVLNDKEKIESEIDKVSKNNDIGILIVTEQVYKTAQEKLDYIKNNKRLPLIVTV